MQQPHASQQIEVAPARLRDLRAVARLQQRAFPKRLAYKLTTLTFLWGIPSVPFLVARQGDRVVGCAIGDRQGDVSRVVNLCVDPDARRLGIGSRLLSGLEGALPHGNMTLMVEAGNEPAKALYRKGGYVQTGVTRNYYGVGYDGIWMTKVRPGAGPPDVTR